MDLTATLPSRHSSGASKCLNTHLSPNLALVQLHHLLRVPPFCRDEWIARSNRFSRVLGNWSERHMNSADDNVIAHNTARRQCGVRATARAYADMEMYLLPRHLYRASM
jgi:hypothetical protein